MPAKKGTTKGTKKGTTKGTKSTPVATLLEQDFGSLSFFDKTRVARETGATSFKHTTADGKTKTFKKVVPDASKPGFFHFKSA